MELFVGIFLYFWLVFLGSNYELTVLIVSCRSTAGGTFVVAWLLVFWGLLFAPLLASGLVAVLSLKANFGSSYFHKRGKRWRVDFNLSLF